MWISKKRKRRRIKVRRRSLRVKTNSTKRSWSRHQMNQRQIRSQSRTGRRRKIKKRV